ncbi:MAG: hypothetical protein WCK51_10775 [Armatimonadota bacterium]
MITSLRWLVSVAVGGAIAVCFAQADFYRSIAVGDRTYVVGPSIKLGQYLSKVKYSPAGNSVVFIEEFVEDSYVVERERVARGQQTSRRLVGRFDIQSGVKSTLFEIQLGEVVMDIDPVGPNGGVICSLVVGKSSGDNLIWKVVYCPVGQGAKVIKDRIVGRSVSVCGSRTDQKAFVFSCGEGCPTEISFVTNSGQKTQRLEKMAYQGGAYGSRTSDGDPIITLQDGAPDYKLLGNYRLSFATGAALPISEIPSVGQTEPGMKPKFVFNEVVRSKGDSNLAQNPLIDIVAESTEKSRGKLLMTQGAIQLIETEALGRSVIYLSNEGGYYLREIVQVLK